MDGNRRYARDRGMPTLAGHKAGYEKLKEVTRWTYNAGIPYLIVYAFSTENWKRDQSEVNYLFDLLRFVVKNEVSTMKKEGIRMRFIGEISRLPEDIQKGIKKTEEETKDGKMTLVIALSYGGRSEIINAVKNIVNEGKGEVTEESFGKYLWTHDIPDPDMIIRTSGEQRLSNFLLWQGAYSELFFTKTYWPAFTEEEYKNLISEFGTRRRRMGR